MRNFFLPSFALVSELFFPLSTEHCPENLFEKHLALRHLICVWLRTLRFHSDISHFGWVPAQREKKFHRKRICMMNFLRPFPTCDSNVKFKPIILLFHWISKRNCVRRESSLEIFDVYFHVNRSSSRVRGVYTHPSEYINLWQNWIIPRSPLSPIFCRTLKLNFSRWHTWCFTACFCQHHHAARGGWRW